MGRLTSCKVCGRTNITINRSRRCLSCAVNKVIAANKQLKAKRGPVYRKWKAAMCKAFVG